MGLRRDEKPITSNNPFEGFVLLEKKNGDTTREQREGLASYSAKGLPSFFSNFKTLSAGAAPGIEPATSRSSVTRSTD